MAGTGSTLANYIKMFAAKVDSSSTSTTKWNPVRNIVAEALNLDVEDVYLTTVALVRNVGVRLTQSKPARAGRIGMVMWTGAAAELEKAVDAAARTCNEIPRPVLIFADSGSGMTLVAIASPGGQPPPAPLASAYPAAVVVSA